MKKIKSERHVIHSVMHLPLGNVIQVDSDHFIPKTKHINIIMGIYINNSEKEEVVGAV